MAKKGITGLFVQVLVGANMATALLMILTGYSYLVNPVTFPLASTMGLFFPFFLLLNILFLVFWLFFYWRKAYVPVLVLFVCYFPVRTYLGINTSETVPEGAIKVMSYNVMSYHGIPGHELSRDSNEIFRYIYDEDCDIICVQEANENYVHEAYRKKMQERYPYHQEDAMIGSGTRLALYTKYKILESDTIRYKSKSNWSIYYKLLIGGEEVYVVNNYLEVSHLSPEDRGQFAQMMRGNLDKDSATVQSKSVIAKLTEGTLTRAPQADAVAKFVKTHRDKRIILMGDFNDNPISYTHHTIGKNLTDCFISTGKGFGWTYCHNAMRVRIDNIMCSADITPYNCKVDSKIGYSDHYPIKCWLKFD